MNKKIQIQLLLEHIANSKTTPIDIQKAYLAMLEALQTYGIYVKSIFTCKQIEAVLKAKAQIQISQYETAIYQLERLLGGKLSEEKKSIFNSLMASNFQAHAKKLEKSKEDFEASLSKVEAKMYHIIALYIQILLVSLDVFIIFSNKEQIETKDITSFALLVHDALMKNIFYKEEQQYMENGLKELLVVYLGVYCKEYSS